VTLQTILAGVVNMQKAYAKSVPLSFVYIGRRYQGIEEMRIETTGLQAKEPFLAEEHCQLRYLGRYVRESPENVRNIPVVCTGALDAMPLTNRNEKDGILEPEV